MKKEIDISADPDLLGDYDFSAGVRGKYAMQYASGTNLVRLDPDISELFPDSEAVNEALRSLVEIARRLGSDDNGHIEG